MKKATKILTLLLCAVLLVCATVAGTVAYLTDNDDVTNTFTAGNVSIELKEYAMDPQDGTVTDSNSEADGVQKTFAEDDGIENIKVIPGRKIEKQPVVIVNEGSESCWLFIKIENGVAGKNLLGSGSFSCSTGWNAVAGQSGWYQYNAAVTAGNYQVFEYFTFGNLSNDDVAALSGGSIKITAYAVQAENVAQSAALDTAISMASGS